MDLTRIIAVSLVKSVVLFGLFAVFVRSVQGPRARFWIWWALPFILMADVPLMYLGMTSVAPPASLQPLLSPLIGPVEQAMVISATGAKQIQAVVRATPFSLPSLWETGALLMLLYLIGGAIWARARLFGRSGPVSERSNGLLARHAPKLHARAADVATPFVLGLFRPTLYLPREVDAWSEADLTAAILHEREHIRRGDAWLDLVPTLACALLWFNPIAWVARRRIDLEREMACDRAAVRGGADPAAFADMLLRLTPRRQVGFAMAATRKALSRRIEALVLKVRPSSARQWMALLLVPLTAAVIMCRPGQGEAEASGLGPVVDLNRQGRHTDAAQVGAAALATLPPGRIRCETLSSTAYSHAMADDFIAARARTREFDAQCGELSDRNWAKGQRFALDKKLDPKAHAARVAAASADQLAEIALDLHRIGEWKEAVILAQSALSGTPSPANVCVAWAVLSWSKGAQKDRAGVREAWEGFDAACPNGVAEPWIYKEMKDVAKDVEAMSHAGDRGMVYEAMRGARPAMLKCYDALLVRTPGVGGKLVARFVLKNGDEHARGTDVVIESTTLNDEEFVRCVSGVIEDVRFANDPNGGATNVSYPFAFTPN